jgi:copper resistance protein B
VAANEVEEFGVGEGLNSVRVRLRLGNEMFRYFALYVENYWVNEYGDTAELSRISGDSTEDTVVVVGVRLIF